MMETEKLKLRAEHRPEHDRIQKKNKDDLQNGVPTGWTGQRNTNEPWKQTKI